MAIELLASALPEADLPWFPPGAIPPKFRAFGKYFDTRLWRAGDLLLSRETLPSRVGKAIESAQKNGGYHPNDARWTHAAIYLGDGFTLCEASFSFWPLRMGVQIANLWEYCGDYCLRLRRPTAVTTEADAWLMSIRALTSIRKDYDFRYVFKLAWSAFRGQGFWSPGCAVPIRGSALVCSTLYADAYTRQTKRILGEQNNGCCTPAYLSQSPEFVDLGLQWRPIAG